jgi:transposase-like protein
MTKPIVRDPIYRRRRCDAEIIELCVRWYITYRLSYRDLVAMMAERGIVPSSADRRVRGIASVSAVKSNYNAF